MAKTKTGTPSIIKLSRKICRLKGTYGAANRAAATSPEFAAAITALIIACTAFEAADDFPGEIDSSAPAGPEDLLP